MIAALLLMAAAPALNCKDPQAQLEMNMCAQRDFERADTELNAQWRATAVGMRESDRGIDRKYDREPGYFETLLAAQRAWITYRRQHCLGESFEARGGSLSPLLFSTCMSELTRERTKQLKALVEVEN